MPTKQEKDTKTNIKTFYYKTSNLKAFWGKLGSTMIHIIMLAIVYTFKY